MECKIGSMRSRALSGIVEMTSFLFATFAMCSFAFVIIHQGHERKEINLCLAAFIDPPLEN